MTLNNAELGKEYLINDVNTDGDDEMKSFLFSLGCYSGEKITVVNKKRNLVEQKQHADDSHCVVNPPKLQG